MPELPHGEAILKKSQSVKHAQLGMPPGTAAGRLIRDILFSFVTKGGHRCFRCGGEMTRLDFSIEHKEAWLHSADPVRMFFDLENIAFSHADCNREAGRKRERTHNRNGYLKGCRCEQCTAANTAHTRRQRAARKLPK